MAGQRVRGTAKTAEIKLGAILGRQVFPLGLLALLLWLARDHLPVLNPGEIWETFKQVRTDQWILAALATGASFWAVGRYDSVLHGLLDTGVSNSLARQSGASAIAIAQFAGFGVITGALVRWHLLPGLCLSRAFKVSLAVSMSFLAGWAVVTAVVILLAGLEMPQVRAAAWLVLTAIGFAALIPLILPAMLTRMPTVQSTAKILGLVLLDTSFAALALYALLPVGIEIAPLTLLAVYLVALGAGLLGSTPGGVGPFEIGLLAMLPAIPDDSIIAAALAFRVVYYAIPASIGLVVLLLGLPDKSDKPVPRLGRRRASAYLPSRLEQILWDAPRAEVNLMRQGNFQPLYAGPDTVALAAPVGQSLIMLGDPVAPQDQVSRTLNEFAECSAIKQRSALVYKCSARTATWARSHGWSVLPVAREAVLDPVTFTLDGARLRQLRRSIRKAEKAGVTVTEAGRSLPLAEMQTLSNRWSVAQGGENGFSMGKFERDYVNCQRVFLAHQNQRLVGFVTFHEVRDEWCLDLMRQDRDTPSGTMQLLILNAIQSAASVRCNRLSLAAVPFDGRGDAAMVGWLRTTLLKRGAFAGLRRFKSSFDPRWETRYALSKSRFSMLHGLISTYRKINKPG